MVIDNRPLGSDQGTVVKSQVFLNSHPLLESGQINRLNLWTSIRIVTNLTQSLHSSRQVHAPILQQPFKNHGPSQTLACQLIIMLSQSNNRCGLGQIIVQNLGFLVIEIDLSNNPDDLLKSWNPAQDAFGKIWEILYDPIDLLRQIFVSVYFLLNLIR